MPRLMVLDNALSSPVSARGGSVRRGSPVKLSPLTPRRQKGRTAGGRSHGHVGTRRPSTTSTTTTATTATTPSNSTTAGAATNQLSTLTVRTSPGRSVGAPSSPASALAMSAYVVPKSAESRRVILVELRKHFVVQQLPEDVHERLADAMFLAEARPGQLVVQQGDVGTRFYVLEDGVIDVVVDGIQMSRITGPGSFGEMALLHDAPRAATLRAAEACRLWCVERDVFRNFVALQAVEAASDKLRLLRKVDILQPLTMPQMAAVAEAVTQQSFAKGEDIIRQGDPDAKHFYIVISGSVDVLVDGHKQASLGEGQFFGERALLVEEPRNATCRCSTAVQCYVLNRHHFESILGSLQSLREISSQREAANHDSANVSGKVLNAHTQQTPKERVEKAAPAGGGGDRPRACKNLDEVLGGLDETIELRHLFQIRTIAVGQRGRVRAVQRRKKSRRTKASSSNEPLFALKSFSKVKVLQAGSAQDVLDELVVMAQLQSPFCCRLIQRFHDANCVYMLSNLVQCGDMYGLVYSSERVPRCRLEGIDLNLVRFYATNIVLGLEHIHSLGYVFRNLLPESIAVGADGYVQIVNFSMAKFLPPGSKTHTLLGQAEYFAPEQVLCQGHDQAVDFYALGCCL
eukprot:INCI14328.2.p1 GENE.INCI14328.2~~INCI14328.2.p1  ORF type:complete len:691 (-),score=99.74 INCI14328.2:576-2468(-)